MSTWTAGKVLSWAVDDFQKRRVEQPRLEAEVLLADVLGCGRLDLYTGFETPLSDAELTRYREAITRRRAGEPAAYILGRREFWSLDLEVGPAVLVPRPDTETLVQVALDRLDGDRALDLCTGSGCVALALASERPGLAVDATEISAEAAAVARRNAERLELAERVRVREGDLFEPVRGEPPYRLITANPPYVCSGDIVGLSPEVRREPRLALDGGGDGLDVIRRILEAAPHHLEPGGWLLVELDPRQGDAVAGELGPALFGAPGEPINDLAGRLRVVCLQKKS